jgi:hypothetical protein
MSDYTLIIRFRGICTHFRNVVPGIPHRVVLPRSEAIRFGIVHAPDTPAGTPDYYLTPHFPFLGTPGGPIPNIDGILLGTGPGDGSTNSNNSYLIGAARIQVANPRNDAGQPEYLPSYTTTRSVREFVPDYEYSAEVVQRGRASCYVDLFNGLIGSGLTRGGASTVTITMLTDGPPQLFVLPIQPLAAGTPPHALTLTPDTPGGLTVTLTVGNLELDPRETDDPQFDYLLHYLTADGGIPRAIAKWTPGMLDPQPQKAQAFASGINGFATIIELLSGGSGQSATLRGTALLAAIGKIDAEDVTPSCSDSRYP